MAPASCVTMNARTPSGAIPAKVSESERAIVTAGLANEVEAVNQLADVMYRPTAYGIALGVRAAQPKMVRSKPNVATASANHCPAPVRCQRKLQQRQFEH